MEIIKTLEDNVCKLALRGRLDTTTAPELEAELKNSLEGIEGLEFDLSDLDYISSAGLRVLLFAQKSMMGKTMVVRNVKPEIMEVFEITGFNDILTIE
ncbi:MAG: STAS domain-containing protein [Erysipelotrichaceae bacterium]|nr:STAS domain-containing protein [Erysipelotrichaceae bacterium]